MANEIDLYKDLELVEKHYKNCIKEAQKRGKNVNLCKYWKDEIKKLAQEIKEKYPDLALN